MSVPLLVIRCAASGLPAAVSVARTVVLPL
jgi:hypothetical protein